MEGNHLTTIDAETYFNYALVKGRSKPDTKIVRVVVDSRERNRTLFENPNNYEVQFPDPIPYVTFVKLIAASIPFSSYLVNANNNALHLTKQSKMPSIARVETGDYEDGESLAGAVAAALNADIGADFIVEYVPLKDNFSIKSASPFRLDFRSSNTIIRGNNPDYTFPTSSMAPMLGFANKTYTSSLDDSTPMHPYCIASEFRKNMEPEEAIVVHIDLFDLNKSTLDAVDGSFAIIQQSDGKYGTFDDFFYSKYFYPPVRISKIRVRITDMQGRPYDFQNQDHRFEFLFESNIKSVS